jgi:hypothetical protein
MRMNWLVLCISVMAAVSFAILPGCSSDPLGDLDQIKDSLEELEGKLNTSPPEDTTYEAIILVEGPGEYPAGRFAGPVRWKARPERSEMVIGSTFEYICVTSEFMHFLEAENTWTGVGSTGPPRNSKEFFSPPEAPSTWLYFGGNLDPLRGPGTYKLIIWGEIVEYEVKATQTGGPDPHKLSRQEIYEEIIFTVIGK